MGILVITGSPRGQNSNTSRLTRAFLKGMGREARWIEACSADVAPCRGCFSCWNDTPGKCSINDGMTDIIDAYLGAELVIFSTPQYCYGLPGPLKNIFDRLLPLSTPEQAVDGDGRTRHVPREKRPPVMLITGCGFAERRLNGEPMLMQFEYFYGEGNPIIYCAQSTLMSLPVQGVAEAYLANVERAGREYAENGRISDETQEKLDAPMLPPNVYRRFVNAAAKSGGRVG